MSRQYWRSGWDNVIAVADENGEPGAPWDGGVKNYVYDVDAMSWTAMTASDTGTGTEVVVTASALPTGAAQEHTAAASPHSVRLSDGSAFYKGATETTLASIQTLLTSDFISGMIEAPSDKTYTLDPASIDARTISSLKIYTTSGTCTVAIKINGTSITGLSAVSVTSTPQEPSASALNTMVLGDALTLVVSASVAPIDLVFRIRYTRTT